MMIARMLTIAGFIAACCTAVAAEDIAGRYAVKGTLVNGYTYLVSAEIVMTSETTCDVNWSDHSKGVCLLDGTTLYMASIVQGKPQLGIYQIAPDGSMEGVLTDNLQGRSGNIYREKLTPVE